MASLPKPKSRRIEYIHGDSQRNLALLSRMYGHASVRREMRTWCAEIFPLTRNVISHCYYRSTGTFTVFQARSKLITMLDFGQIRTILRAASAQTHIRIYNTDKYTLIQV